MSVSIARTGRWQGYGSASSGERWTGRTLGVARCSGTSAANGSKIGYLGRSGNRNGSSINHCRCHSLRKNTRSLRIQIIPKGEKIMSTDLSLIRILTVDDHPLLRKGIAALVNAENDMKLVAEACNGEEAIEKFRSHRPDVTLMDLQMPGLNGIEAIIHIQSEFPDARIIVLTTYTGDAQVVRALQAGARAYLDRK